MAWENLQEDLGDLFGEFQIQLDQVVDEELDRRHRERKQHHKFDPGRRAPTNRMTAENKAKSLELKRRARAAARSNLYYHRNKSKPGFLERASKRAGLRYVFLKDDPTFKAKRDAQALLARAKLKAKRDARPVPLVKCARPGCAVKFFRKYKPGNPRLYCSKRCCWQVANERKPLLGVVKGTCRQCRNEFVRSKHGGNKRVYCSKECRTKWTNLNRDQEKHREEKIRAYHADVEASRARVRNRYQETKNDPQVKEGQARRQRDYLHKMRTQDPEKWQKRLADQRRRNQLKKQGEAP